MSLFPDGRPALNYKRTTTSFSQTRVVFRRRELNTTATQESPDPANWQVYPSPATDQVWLHLPDSRMRRIRLYTC